MDHELAAITPDARDLEREVADGGAHPHVPCMIASAASAARRPAASAAPIEPSRRRAARRRCGRRRPRAVDVSQRHEAGGEHDRVAGDHAVVALERLDTGGARTASARPVTRIGSAPRGAAPRRRVRPVAVADDRGPAAPATPVSARWQATVAETTPCGRSPSIRSSARFSGRAPAAITSAPARTRRTSFWPRATSGSSSQVIAVSPRWSRAPAVRAACSSRRVASWSSRGRRRRRGSGRRRPPSARTPPRRRGQ